MKNEGYLLVKLLKSITPGVLVVLATVYSVLASNVVLAKTAVQTQDTVNSEVHKQSGKHGAKNDISSPSQEVEAITRSLLKTFQENKERYQKDHSAFVAEVDRLLSPVVAFDSIARGVMGKYAHRAEPVQITQFEKNFKDSLIRFYGKALLKLDDTSVQIQKVDDVPGKVLDDYKAGKIRQIPVTMTAKTSSRTLEISYSMIFDDNRWKLRNIVLDGINIGIQFRRQFAEAVESHRKLQYVIDHWLDIMSVGSDLNKADSNPKKGA